MPSHVVQKTVRVHPPEAESISCALGRVRSASETILGRLMELRSALDQEWEGRQQTVFQRELEGSIECFSKNLLPRLRLWEAKYRDFIVEEEIEAVEYY
jgi:hypothetical protein